MTGAIRLWCAAPPNQYMGREPLLPGGEFLFGETGQYRGPLVLLHQAGFAEAVEDMFLH